MSGKQLMVFIGNYGSGKTELAINFALDAARQGKCTALVDLDIVNTYFRSTEQADFLRDAGVRVIASPFGGRIDLPVVSPEVARAFDDDSLEFVVFDVGGDPVGATALGRYHAHFARMGSEKVHAYFVVNARRPLTQTADEIATLYDQIQSGARLSIEGFINNGNLAGETTAQDLLDTQAVLHDVCDRIGKPVVYTCGWQKTLDAFAAVADLSDCVGTLVPIETVMRPAWLDFHD